MAAGGKMWAACPVLSRIFGNCSEITQMEDASRNAHPKKNSSRI
jgi:hypothetical protein